MNTNNAPFFVGQKVVSLVDFPGHLVKGNIYTIFCQFKCVGCGTWSVGFAPHNFKNTTHTCHCGGVLPPTDGYYTADADKFAPIEENRERIKYVAVSETLREKAHEVVIQNLTTS